MYKQQKKKNGKTAGTLEGRPFYLMKKTTACPRICGAELLVTQI